MKRPITILLLLGVLLIIAATSSGASSLLSPNSAINVRQGLVDSMSRIPCPQDASTLPAPLEKKQITLTVAGWSSSPAEQALVNANLSRFEQLHPNIHVEWQPFLGHYPTKMQASLINRDMPDVFYLQPGMASEYIPAGALLNLSPYMTRDSVKGNEFYFTNMFSCKGGQVYGIPKDFSALGLFYNKDLFQRAGVPYPTERWTWEDMRAAAKKLTRKGAAARAVYRGKEPVYGLTLPINSSRWLAFLYASGGSVLNEDGTRATFNSAQGAKSLEYYTSFQREDGSSVLPSALVPGWAGDVFDAFGEEYAAMAIEGSWLIPYLHEKYPSFQHYSLAPLPLGPQGKRANLVFTNAWSAYSKTAHPAAAWELIKYMTGQEVQRSQLYQSFALPTLKSLATDAYFTANPSVKMLFDSAQVYGYPDYYGLNDTFIHERLNQAITSTLSGQLSARKALDNAARQVNAILKT
jgi:multiple sugar transport system substrate-binding protein